MVGEEPADVDERAPALLDAGDDAGEVVVEEDEVGGLAGDIGARHARYRDADVGLVQRQPVVQPVAGHHDDVATGGTGAGDAQLVPRRHTGDDHAVDVDDLAECHLVVGQVGSDEHRRVAGTEAHHIGNGSRRGRMVAGDHRDANRPQRRTVMASVTSVRGGSCSTMSPSSRRSTSASATVAGPVEPVDRSRTATAMTTRSPRAANAPATCCAVT